ncbi:MAG: branched-chain amino acid ABC transporter permease [Alphaproteobacteria bacterium]|nr:branched-chain amino acid ABC transporter permease [Alphaproteobacteria bacterium]
MRRFPPLAIAGFLVVVAALLALPAFAMPYHVRVGQLFLLSTALVLAWHILGGFAGYWSFGHTAFVGIGAFAAGLLHVHLKLPPMTGFVVGTLIGGLASGAIAALLAYPVLRLRGIYFAIALLGVSQVFGELAQNVDAFQGALGITLPDVVPDDIRPEVFFYYVFWLLAVGTFLLSAWMRDSRLGYGLAAIREDEDTARMLGVPTERFKVMTFVLSAALTGLVGAVYAYSLGYFTAGSVFRVDFSLNMILHALLGGIGTLTGPVIGAALLVFITHVLLGWLLDLHLLVTGVLVVALVLLAPNGLLGILRRWRERKAGR